MDIIIKEVTKKSELKKFVKFNIDLYKNNPYHVPGLIEEEMVTLDKKKNPAFEVCDAIYFLAYKGGKIVGRIAGMINRPSNETWGQKRARFGFVDFIDDDEVVDALFGAVEKWAREQGMNELHGPMGFTDMDHEGMLIEGFDQVGTMATIYNYPYYPQHMEKLGLEKDADWVEFKIQVPATVPEKMQRIADLVSRKYNLHVKKLKNMKEICDKGYGQKIFKLINECYAPLYGYSQMTEAQIRQYIKMYLPILDLRMVTLIEDENDELIAVGVSMPSLSVALQKAKGRILPFGWYHLVKALFWKKPKTLDLLLVGVKPEYQSKGVNALLFADLIPVYTKIGFRFAESNPELETNNKVQAQWEYFETTQHKRRRAYKKMIN